MDIVCKKSQSTSNLSKMIHIASRPKKILQLWLWWAPPRLQLKPPAVPNVINNKESKLEEGTATKFHDYSRENSKESLLVGSELISASCSKPAGRVCTPRKVPKGFLAVYVGADERRFVIPLSCLSTPEFMGLMDEVAEEFGYAHQEGGLHIPCKEEDFEEMLLRCLRIHKDMASKSKIRKKP